MTARAELQTLGDVALGMLLILFGIIAGYFVLRYAIRKKTQGRGYPQSLFIAVLSAGWPLFGAAVLGFVSGPLGILLMGIGVLVGALFVFIVFDEVRRAQLRGKEGE